MNLEKGIEIYLQWKNSYTDVAASRYSFRLRGFKRFIGEQTLLSTITGDQIVQYQLSMENQYSPTTIAYSSRILKNFFEFWKGRGESSLNPKEIISARYTSPIKDIISREDFEDMSDILDEQCYADLIKKLTIHLLWDTGMRVSELCDMKISALEKNEEDELFYTKVRTRKSMRYNLVVWGKRTNDLLTKYLGIRICLNTSSDYLIYSAGKKKGEKTSIRTVQRWVKQLSKEAMIDKEITPHSFRHSKAHDMLDQGANVRDVQAILRHVNPGSSFHYLALNPTKFLSVAKKYIPVT